MTTLKPLTEVQIGSLILKNPVMTASGTFGYGEEYAPYIDLNRLGAVVVKGISLDPRRGNPPPRIMETPGGMLNAIGLQNVGVKAFIGNKLPWLRQFDTKVIVNIFGETLEEYGRVAAELSGVDGIHALEVNISCPNVRKGGHVFGCDPDASHEVTKVVKSATDLPVIVKLSPNVSDITEIARSCEAAGADALSLINTLLGMSIDIERRIPHLKNVTGGLSGHRYLLAHRHTPTAARLGKICYDLEERFVLHFHATDLPPEEEILAAKLILEHREPWLRNEATVVQQTKDGRWHDLGFMRYKNPFGDITDGRDDAALTAGIGIGAEYAMRARP